MIIDWPKELVDDIARRRSVIVLGSGISRQSVNAAGVRPPMWAGFLKTAVVELAAPKATKEAITKLINSNDMLTACEAIKEQMGQATFRDYIRSQFLTPQFQPVAIHDSIISLDSRITATP